MPSPKKKKSGAPEQPTLLARFTKGSLCRVIHVDGGFGGMTPQGNLHLALYSEHIELPETLTYGVVDGQPVEVKRSGGGNLIREREVEIVMSRGTAASIRDWIANQLTQLDVLIAEADAQKAIS